MEPISVMLIDDNLTFLNATAQFLEAYDDVTVIGTAGGGAEALGKVHELKPQVILIDLAMPGLPGLEVIPRLRKILPNIGIIALTVMNTKSFRRAALAAGADNFVPKPAMRRDLLPAIRQVAENCPKGKEQEPSADAGGDNGSSLSRRVLLMEDDHSTRRLYARVLYNAGFVIDEAGTLQEARDLLAQSKFGLFLCDIHMGRERGTDLVREQQDVLAANGTQIIMISANPQYRSICTAMGVKEYLEKPISLVHLVQVVNRIAGR